jgi:integrase
MGRVVVRGTRDEPKVYADYYDLDGTRRTRLLRGARTKAEGRKLLSHIESRVASGKPGMEADEAKPPPVALCGALFDLWLPTLQNRNGRDDHRRAEKHLRPTWGDVPVDEAQNLAGVMRWLDRMRAAQDLSGQSMRHNLNLLSRFFAWAIERGHATVNPVRMIPQGKRPRGAAKADGPWIRDDDTFRALMVTMPRPVDLMFYVGNRSGLRVGEIAGLRMGDLCWLREGLIRVAHSYDGPLKEDKDRTGKVKWVPAGIDAEDVLGPWLRERTENGAREDDLVFPFAAVKPQNRRRKLNWTGYRKEHIEDCWDAAKAKVNTDARTDPVLAEMTFYEATRHSFVTRSLEAGVSLDEISAAVGHSSPVVTKRFYDRYIRKSFSATIRGARPVTGAVPQPDTGSP